MMSSKYIFNRRLCNMHKQEQINYLKLKLKKIKSFIDLKCPESFSLSRRRFNETKPKKNTCNNHNI